MPPKKNKKPSRNGFWEFVMECRDKSNKTLSQGELTSYASKKWNVMTPKERQPYEDRARLARDSFTSQKLTSAGLDVEELERQEKEQTEKTLIMKNEISKMLKAAYFSLTLGDQVFLLIHINNLIHYPPEDRYLICEVAIAAISLKNGIEDVYHSIVYSGTLPIGYAGGAMHHSKETHQLYALVMEEPIQVNVGEVFTEMTQFIKNYVKGSSPAILYTCESLMPMTKNVIDDFRDRYGYKQEIKVYSVQYLLHSLKNTASEQIVWNSESFSHRAFEKDIYSHSAGIGCEFHEVSDFSVHCSKSIVTRYGYTICDYCCKDLDIKLEPGFHLPQNAKVESESRATSKAPSISSHDGYRNATRSRVDSLSGASYDSNFPALDSYRSNASVESFSSMQSMQKRSSSSKAAARIEQSFKTFSLNESKRDTKNLKFPEHRFKKPE